MHERISKILVDKTMTTKKNLNPEELLHMLTVDCKDNGREFVINNRIEVIKNLLSDSPYQLLYEGDLCLIYSKNVGENNLPALISSHVDCVFNTLRCDSWGEKYMIGTFDNSATNACLIYTMLQDTLGDNVLVVFTGDEEANSRGAAEVVTTLHRQYIYPSVAMVLDVTEAGWMEEYDFTIENDLEINIVKGHRIIEAVKPFEGQYLHIHAGDADESWEYDERNIPTFSLCLPVCGDIHGDEGVLIRRKSLSVYCDVLCRLARCFRDNKM